MLTNNKKRKVLLLSLVMVLLITAGVTIAFLITDTQDVENTFEPTQVSCEVTEDFDSVQLVKENVAVKNTSDIDAFIRAEVIISWKNEAGDVYGMTPVTGSENQLTDDYIISYNLNENGWTQGSDGFYYYKGIVAPGASTDVLINRCVPVAGKAPEGYYLSVEIIASAIQADGESFGAPTGVAEQHPVEIAWPAVEVSGSNLVLK